MAQACAALVFDKSNVVSAMVEFQCSQTHASEMLPSAGGVAESLAHHEVVGKRKKESEPWRGDTLLSGVHFHGLRCPQIMRRLKIQNKD